MKHLDAIGQNIERIEQALAQDGFNITNRVGEFKKTKLQGYLYTSYFLYVDDTNKKWLLTSPLLSSMEKVRDFGDLLSYDVFDIDGKNLGGSTFRAMSFGIGKHMSAGASASAAYGFSLSIKRSDGFGAADLKFDFMDAASQFISQANISKFQKFAVATMGDRQRSDPLYRKDIAAMGEMATVFDRIIRANT